MIIPGCNVKIVSIYFSRNDVQAVNNLHQVSNTEQGTEQVVSRIFCMLHGENRSIDEVEIVSACLNDIF